MSLHVDAVVDNGVGAFHTESRSGLECSSLPDDTLPLTEELLSGPPPPSVGVLHKQSSQTERVKKPHLGQILTELIQGFTEENAMAEKNHSS